MNNPTPNIRRDAATFQPCLSSGIFNKGPLAEAVRPIAAAGFRWMEISRRSSGWAAAAPILEGEGIRIWSIHGPGVFYLDDPSEEAVDAAIEKERRVLEQAAIYAPCPYVLHYLRMAPGPDADARCVVRMDRLAKCCTEAGVELCMELLPAKAGPERHVGNAAELIGLLQRMSSVPVSVCIDMNHSNLVEPLPEAIRTCHGRIGNVHISDNLGATDDHLLPGEGIIDWPPVLRALREADYRGALNMEIHLPDRPTHELLVRLREWAEQAAATES